MNFSSLFSKTLFTVAVGAALGFAAATCRLEFPGSKAVALDAPTAKAFDTTLADVDDETTNPNTLTDDDKVALAKHNRLVSTAAAQSSKKPNIIVLWGDDIGVHNISAYNHGIMGYQTPNIDRIAKEGALFTDSYSQQSCTAGRASFILGQHPFRTGLLTIGMPGSPQGIPD